MSGPKITNEEAITNLYSKCALDQQPSFSAVAKELKMSAEDVRKIALGIINARSVSNATPAPAKSWNDADLEKLHRQVSLHYGLTLTSSQSKYLFQQVSTGKAKVIEKRAANTIIYAARIQSPERVKQIVLIYNPLKAELVEVLPNSPRRAKHASKAVMRMNMGWSNGS